MSLGQRVSLTLSPDMGYGEAGAGDGIIPPNATLIFDLEIIKIDQTAFNMIHTENKKVLLFYVFFFYNLEGFVSLLQ